MLATFFASIAAVLAMAVAGDGGEAAPAPCEEPQVFPQQPPVARRARAEARSLDVLGAYSNDLGRGNRRDGVHAVDINWARLAESHVRGFRAAAPLPVVLRRAAAAAYRDRERDPESYGPPVFQFTAPAGDAPEGPYFLLDAEGFAPARIERLEGAVSPMVDVEGCETAARAYSGDLIVARVGAERHRGGFLVRSRNGPLSFRFERVEARLVAKGEVEVTARGAPASWRVPSPQGLAFSVAHNGSGALHGESLMGAVMFTVHPRGERLLLIHTAMEANCETQLALFLLGEKGPELIASAARDCDV